MKSELSNEDLSYLRRMAMEASPGPWTSMVEGRDHSSGDSFIMVGREDDRDEDLYLMRDSGPASSSDYDFIAAARNYFTVLIDEIERLRTRD